MALWGATDQTSDKPKWLTTTEKADCLGADTTETTASTKIMHQGWTVPAGGNGNPDAQRETLVTVNLTTDVGASDDSGLGMPEPGTRYAVTLHSQIVAYAAGMGGYGVVTLYMSYPDEASADADWSAYKSGGPIQTTNGLRIYTGSNVNVGPGTSDGFDLDGSVQWEANYQWDGMMNEAMMSLYGGPVSGAQYSNMPIAAAGSMGAVAGAHGTKLYDWSQSSPSMGTMIQLRF
tara:strand:+ start:221 stop:919 length:699 start_codon:yes stop_codon:yes gene_type:complete